MVSIRLRRRGAAAALATALALCLPASAAGVVSNVQPIDGPAAGIGSEVDAAMAEDGTGGVVYLKQVDGRNHVFAARFVEGRWTAPQRVDLGQSFDSSWPRIAAGDGGRLLVTWVHEFGVSTDRMFSATLDPGATGFRDPVPVDFNVGEATGTWPDLAMNRGGQAYLVYRVVTDTSPSNPQGYVGAEIRLSRYSNRLWSSFGAVVDRNSSIPMRSPSIDNAPKVGIDLQGQGVVAWQEPDDEFVDRIWARRLFSNRFGIPLQASPSSFDGAPLRGGADAISLDVAGFGRSAVAFRQQPGQASRLDGTHVMLNQLPEVFVEEAGSFGEAKIVDGVAREALGTPSVAVDPNSLFIAGFSSANATLLASGDDLTIGEVARLDTGASSIPGAPVVDLAETGAAVTAWREQNGDVGLVRVQERRADGVVESASVSAPSGGAVGLPAIGGSSLGDAIIAFGQGSGANAQIAATVVNAPPDPFIALLPLGWQGDRQIPIAWEPTRNAVGEVSYSVSVDDEPVIEGVGAEEAVLKRDDIDDGRHQVQVFAVDEAGQETGSPKAPLQVDRSAPEVELAVKGRVVSVSVSDGSKRQSAGLRQTTVAFGDGAKAKPKPKGKSTTARARHRFKRPGSFKVTVSATDRAGNKASVRRKVRAR